ncbi:MAG: PadR family transcriptional regulator [Solirubrobacterales bacterium]
MAELTRLEAVVVGLLAERPAHGYELKARLGPGLPREAQLNDGVLYPLLARLERRGLASSAEERRGGRVRRVFAATPDGDAAFREWLLSDRDEDAAVGSELFVDHPLAKLLFASRLTAAELDAKLESLHAAARARLAALDAVPQTGPDPRSDRIGSALLAVGQARELAAIEQLEELRLDLASGA